MTAAQRAGSLPRCQHTAFEQRKSRKSSSNPRFEAVDWNVKHTWGLAKPCVKLALMSGDRGDVELIYRLASTKLHRVDRKTSL